VIKINIDINFDTQTALTGHGQGSIYDSHNPSDSEEVVLNKCTDGLNWVQGSAYWFE